MSQKDIFCKIIDGDIKGDIIDETDEYIVVNDLHPQTPKHVLIIPKKHIGGVLNITEEDTALVGRLLKATKYVTEKIGVKEDGFRVIINSGKHGGQSVDHLHIHILGGRHMGETMVN